MLKTFTFGLLAAAACATADVDFTSIGKFSVKNAAFPTVTRFEDSEPFLLVSSFGVMSSGALYVVPDISAAVVAGDASTLKSNKLDTPHFEWPNNVQVVPRDVFGQRAIAVPDGFLVPGKTHGGIYVVLMDESDITQTVSTTKISTEKKGFYYHIGEWVDLNGDGRKDYLTARSNAKKN